MPAQPPHPSARPLLHRKVMMRLAMLGMASSQLFNELFPDLANHKDKKKRHYTPVKFNRLLTSPSRCDQDTRRRMEELLALPVGALTDRVPLAVIGVVPVPPGYEPEGAKAPDDSDVEEGGPFASTFGTLLTVSRSVEAPTELLRPLTPTEAWL